MDKRALWKKAAESAADLLFPPRCPFCDEPVPPGRGGACGPCRERVSPVGEPFCLLCGKPLRDARQEYCGDCAEGKHRYVCGRALYEYGDVKEAIYRFKYGGRREYAAYLGDEMAGALGAFVRRVQPDGLVPVPLGRRRRRKRGYNQAELLARRVGERLGVPVYADVIARVKDTVPQKILNPGQRQNNLKRAFKIVRNDVKLSTIIIVDDIYTTGSTIDAVAEVLLRAGARKVYYIVLAIGNGM